jgi:hypothetical protein
VTIVPAKCLTCGSLQPAHSGVTLTGAGVVTPYIRCNGCKRKGVLVDLLCDMCMEKCAWLLWDQDDKIVAAGCVLHEPPIDHTVSRTRRVNISRRGMGLRPFKWRKS